MVHALPSDVIEELRSHIVRDVAAGMLPADEIVDASVEMLEGDIDPEALRAQATRLCGEALIAHAAAQASWPAVTDCDRLDQAFAALEAMGIVARQHFTCCGTCGVAEIGDEIASALDQGRAVEGYAFYHQQDTESAVEGHGVYLNDGAVDGEPEGAIKMGHAIVGALSRHGLAADWNGDLSRRIAVPLDWKRRRSIDP